MLRRNKEDVEWLEYELLADCPGIDLRVFLRSGGFSEGHYSSLNFGGTPGDDSDKVKANFSKIRKLLDCEEIVHAEQCHGTEIIQMNSNDSKEKFKCDGLSTNIFRKPLLIKHADCQATCLYDPINQAVTLVHCGWRGNVQNIYAKAVEHMKANYMTDPADILACVSPSLGPERSEFINYKTELPEEFWKFQFRENYFNLWDIAEWQLKKAGLLSHHIQVARECTWKNEKDYFSYRRSKITGNLGSIAYLK